MNIDEMEAGRELDALIAEKVMGWFLKTRDNAVTEFARNRITKPSQKFWYSNIGGKEKRKCSIKKFKPSTDIAAAWQVVEHLNKSGLIINITVALPINEMFQYSVTIPGFDIKYAKTIPLAVCRAALKTVVSP